MGWFDNDKDSRPHAPQPPAAPATRPVPPAASAQNGGGSTLGERVHVNGTIVCEESLRILGKVEGTIHARHNLTIAKGADVRAVIHGRQVNVEGSINGDVNASELVVLGPSASLMGNIRTPSLQIREGAFFKGSVEMSSSEPAKKADKTAAEAGPSAKPAPVKASAPAEAESATTAQVRKAESGGRPAGQ